MSQLYDASNRRKTPSHRLGLPLIFALWGALLLAISSGAALAQSDGVIGRGFTGVVMGVDTNTGLLTVESKGAFFQLIIADSTVVNNIPDQDVGLGGLPTSTGFRIAGLVDLAITDAAGNITPELLTAQKITVIPVKATRRHKRTIAVDKQGDKIIILVQSSGQSGIGEIVRGLFRADIVKDRLDRLIDAQAHDPQKTVILADLRSKREDAHQLRLQRTADNAGTDFRDFVRSTVQPLQEDAEIETAPGETGQTIPEDEPVPEPPVVHIDSPSSGTIVSANDLVTVTAEAKADAGLVSVTFNIGGSDLDPMTAGPYVMNFLVPTGVSSVQIKVAAVDEDGNEASDAITLEVARAADVGVTITSPAATVIAIAASGENSRLSTVSGSIEAIAEGETIIIRAEVSGTGAITVVFTLNGVDQTPFTAPPYAMSYFVPLTSAADAPKPLEITATATDGSGNTASDSVSVTVVRDTAAVSVRITNPPANAEVEAGDEIVIRAETDDDSEIAFVAFSVDGQETIITTAPYVHPYKLPLRADTTASVSNIPPNVFVGRATLDGAPAPDGTVVIAWIAGPDATTLNIKVTATANSGVTGTASLSLPVSGSMNAGEAVVKHGRYVLNAAQPAGQEFTGKTVTFTVGGKDARQTATWKKGDANVVDLTAS